MQQQAWWERLDKMLVLLPLWQFLIELALSSQWLSFQELVIELLTSSSPVSWAERHPVNVFWSAKNVIWSQKGWVALSGKFIQFLPLGIKATPLAMKFGVLTTGPLGSCQIIYLRGCLTGKTHFMEHLPIVWAHMKTCWRSWDLL